jgi:hypothetical protein
MRGFSAALFISFLTIGIVGCGSALPYRTAPDLASKTPGIHTVMLMPADVEVFELGTGGDTEKMDDWCEQARTNVINAVKNQLQGRATVMIRECDSLQLPSTVKRNLEETQALFQAVNASVVLHTYGEGRDRFDDKIKKFDYSLGGEVRELSDSADAYLFVRGVDYISSSGRTAAQVGAVIVGALFGMSVTPHGAPTFLAIALVDAKTGELLWHTYTAEEGTYDLRDMDKTSDLVKRGLKSFPVK